MRDRFPELVGAEVTEGEVEVGRISIRYPPLGREEVGNCFAKAPLARQFGSGLKLLLRWGRSWRRRWVIWFGFAACRRGFAPQPTSMRKH